MKPRHGRLRRRQRGAALVEAAVVLPVLIGFLALFTFVYAEFSAKQRTMATSRSDAFSRAIHACKHGASEPAGGFGPPPGTGPVDPGKAESGMSDGFMQTSAFAKENAVAAGRAREVRSDSFVYCSPKNLGELAEELVNDALELVRRFLG